VTAYRIDVNESTEALYQQQADKRGVTIEAVLAERLETAAPYSSERPIYIDDANRKLMEAMLAKNLFKPEDVLREFRRLTEVDCAGVKVSLPPNVLERLKSRCFEQDFQAWLAKQVIEWAERAAEMR